MSWALPLAAGAALVWLAGFTVRFSTPAAGSLEFVVTDETHELLELDALAVPPRPNDMMAVPSRLSEAVLVTRRWVLPASE